LRLPLKQKDLGSNPNKPTKVSVIKYSKNKILVYAVIAQLAEYFLGTEEVASSILANSTIKKH
jgi:hypothetical protein